MDNPFVDPMDDADLTRAILARTTGAPCERLKGLACDLVDGILDADHRALAGAHLELCPACAAFVAALRESSALLPFLAEVDPGPAFTDRVLRVTVHRPQPPLDVGALWTRLMHRPRIALETAYLGAAAGFLGFGLPSAQLLKAWRAPALVQPLGASARRVGTRMAKAEQRIAASAQGIFAPREGRPPNLWQRLFAKVRAWFHRGAPNAANP